jgi:hypothetical protein
MCHQFPAFALLERLLPITASINIHVWMFHDSVNSEQTWAFMGGTSNSLAFCYFVLLRFSCGYPPGLPQRNAFDLAALGGEPPQPWWTGLISYHFSYSNI